MRIGNNLKYYLLVSMSYLMQKSVSCGCHESFVYQLELCLLVCNMCKFHLTFVLLVLDPAEPVLSYPKGIGRYDAKPQESQEPKFNKVSSTILSFDKLLFLVNCKLFLVCNVDLCRLNCLLL